MTAPDSLPFSRLLRGLREARSLTQEELAARADLSAKAIGALERGERRRPYPHTVRAIADALELDTDDRAALVRSVPARGQGVRPGEVRAASTGATGPHRHMSGHPDGASAWARGRPTTPMLGREVDLERIVGLVLEGDRRLVTLTGPGGVGKTRLAGAVAARLAVERSHETFLVELASVRDPGLVLVRLAAVLGIPDGGGDLLDAVAARVAGRPMLALLDNLEQVLDCAPTVAALVARCPALVVLATSRAPLRVRAEQEVRIAPLAVPDEPDATLEAVAASPAVALLLDRCRAAGADLDVRDDNAAALAGICRRLGGLPLALELAAAGTRMLAPAELLDRLGSGDVDGTIRDLPDRQRTMARVLDWSHDLLEDPARLTLMRLAVFSGDFDLDAAATVCADDVAVETSLTTLVDHALVQRHATPAGTTSFSLLEPVRQDSMRRLVRAGLSLETADRHATYVHAVAEQALAGLRGASSAAWLDRLDGLQGDLRTGLLRLVETDRGDDAAELLRGVWLHLALRGHVGEGLGWTGRLDGLAMSDAARCVTDAARMGLLYAVGDLESMSAIAAVALPRARRSGRDELVLDLLLLGAGAAVLRGDLAGGRQLLGEATTMAAGTVGTWATAQVLLVEAQIAIVAGDRELAGRRTDEAVAAARDLGEVFTLAAVLNLRASAATLRGDLAIALDSSTEAAHLSLTARMTWPLAYALPALAGLALATGQAQTAARLFGAGATVRASSSVDPVFPTTEEQTRVDLAAAHETLGADAFRATFEDGRAATNEQLVELVAQLRDAGA